MPGRTGSLQLLTAATATNSAPTLSSDGVALAALLRSHPYGTPFSILVASTAGSVTMTVTLKLWLYSEVSATWSPLGTAAVDANRGLLNGGVAIGEVISDSLNFIETVSGIEPFERMYLEITAITGTETAVSAWLVG